MFLTSEMKVWNMKTLDGCVVVFVLNGLLTPDSVYIGLSPREGERKEIRWMREKCPNNPLPHLLQVQ